MTETRKKSSARDTFESLIVTVILAVFGTTFVVQAFKIPSGSMENTLLIGDHLLVNKFAFAYQPGWLRRILPYKQPHPGNILVFKFPGAAGSEQEEPGTHFVKRLIAVPGDRFRMVRRQVFVNGQALNEPYVRNDYLGEVAPGDDFPPATGEVIAAETSAWAATLQDYVRDGQLVVPAASYFVLGDNREHSWDGRFWGFVPQTLITGRPLMIYWSYETAPDEYLRTALRDRVTQTLEMALHFFTRTRWRRTFKFVH